MDDYLSELSYTEEELIVYILLLAESPGLTRVNKRFRDIYVRSESRLIVCHVEPKRKVYTLFGKRHRNHDLPAVVRLDGTQKWYQYGKLHRDHDLPAVVCMDGDQVWYQHGKRHRDNDLPAVIYEGFLTWYQRDEVHRDNDLPAIICAGMFQAWYHHGKQHRNNDLPAVIDANGNQAWYQHGELVRSL